MRTCFAFNFSFFSLYMYIYICIIIANQFQEFQTNVNYATLYIWNDCIIIKPSLDKKVVKLALYIYIYISLYTYILLIRENAFRNIKNLFLACRLHENTKTCPNDCHENTPWQLLNERASLGVPSFLSPIASDYRS